MTSTALISWQQEKQSAYLYRVMAARTNNPAQQRLFSQLAEEAEGQADIWAKTIQEVGANQLPSFHPDLRLLIVKQLIIWFGPKAIRPILSATKIRGMSVFNSSDTIGHPMPQTLEDVGRRHQSVSSGNNIRAGVFGINDGLVSNTSLILGMAGGQASHATILLAGIAGLLAGAFSMAAGEFISVRSQREMLEYQLELERKELELYPEEEAEELALIYEARGLPRDDAVKTAQTIIKDPAQAIITLAKEELGLDPNELVSPYGAAIFSFISFMIGAGVPLIPFLFSASNFLSYSITATAITLFIVGAVLSLYTGRNAFKNGLRMLLIGSAAGLLTYLIGHLVSSFI
jgi:VIT1/CCC1 family predicted Fe2+/Mn2+ transporter